MSETEVREFVENYNIKTIIFNGQTVCIEKLLLEIINKQKESD